MQGQIVNIISDIHVVRQKNMEYACKCRGKFRNNKMTPLVGDYVVFDCDKKVIEEILPRENEFVRPAVSNIDQVFIITSVKNPDFSTNLLDKLLVMVELKKVRPIICISKEDLLTKQQLKEIKPIIKYYRQLGYKVISNTKLKKIKKYFKNKTSVFTGQTGSGKSTLINRLNPKLHLETGEISLALGRGKHTTRTVKLLEFCGGKILDTPGFSSLNFNDYSKEEIKDAFIEFKKFTCPYADCFHIKERECSVKQAVKDNKILKSRYENYCKIIKEGK